MKPTYEQLEKALAVAVNMVFVHEPGDSRAVSDTAVALAAVQCGLVDDAVMTVINAALDYKCENCIGMPEHGCYCKSVGATQPGGPRTLTTPLDRRE